MIVGNLKGELPIHDRWWLTKGTGLRIGTSFGSLGNRKESEISTLTTSEAIEREAEIDEFLRMQKREHNGERLSVMAFTL
jgi:hypothetical protein